MQPQFVGATKEPRELVWISEHVPLLTQKDGFNTHTHTPPHHNRHPLPPSVPTVSMDKKRKKRHAHKKRKKTCPLWALLHFFLFAVHSGKLVSLPLPIPPSLFFLFFPLLVFVCHVLGMCSCFAQSSCSAPNAGFQSGSSNFKIHTPSTFWGFSKCVYFKGAYRLTCTNGPQCSASSSFKSFSAAWDTFWSLLWFDALDWEVSATFCALLERLFLLLRKNKCGTWESGWWEDSFVWW